METRRPETRTAEAAADAVRTQWGIIARARANGGMADELDPDALSGSPQLFARLVRRDGWETTLSLWPESLTAMAREDPSADPADRYPGSNWEDLAAAIEPLSWAWQPWLLRGMLTMLVSEQGLGKSILALRIADCFLRGKPWPDDTPYQGAPDGSVLWCEAESSQGLNLKRASDWGLPKSRVLSPLDNALDDVLLQDAEHIDRIAASAGRPNVRLVIVDSLSGANLARENSAAMVHVVKNLADIARDTGKPVILTHHLRKRGLMDSDTITLDRIRGSGAIVQPARVVWALDQPDPNSEARRLSVIKNNVRGIHGIAPLGVRISGDGVTFGDAPEEPQQESLAKRAAEALLALLGRGPRRATDLQTEIEGAGLSWYAAKRAKKRLGVVAVRQTDASTGKPAWYWALPARETAPQGLPHMG